MIQYISANDAYRAAQEGAVLIDVREEIETSDIWINMENVLNIPFSTFAKKMQEIPKNKPLIFCCAIGLVSEKATKLLLENDYQSIFILENGLIAWQLAELPLKTAEATCCQCKCENNKSNEGK